LPLRSPAALSPVLTATLGPDFSPFFFPPELRSERFPRGPFLFDPAAVHLPVTGFHLRPSISFRRIGSLGVAAPRKPGHPLPFPTAPFSSYELSPVDFFSPQGFFSSSLAPAEAPLPQKTFIYYLPPGGTRERSFCAFDPTSPPGIILFFSGPLEPFLLDPLSPSIRKGNPFVLSTFHIFNGSGLLGGGLHVPVFLCSSPKKGSEGSPKKTLSALGFSLLPCPWRSYPPSQRV